MADGIVLVSTGRGVCLHGERSWGASSLFKPPERLDRGRSRHIMPQRRGPALSLAKLTPLGNYLLCPFSNHRTGRCADSHGFQKAGKGRAGSALAEDWGCVGKRRGCGVRGNGRRESIGGICIQYYQPLHTKHYYRETLEWKVLCYKYQILIILLSRLTKLFI